MSTSLVPLFRLVEGPTLPRMPARAWRERLGEDVVSGLRRGGVLSEAGQAGFLPCREGGACLMRIVENPMSPTHPLVAVCEREDGTGCEPEELTADDAVLLVLSLDGVVRQLRRALGLTAAASNGDAGFPEVVRLGEQGGRPTFLARQPGLPGFSTWLGALPTGLVFVPIARAIEDGVMMRFCPGSPVELRTLEATVRLDGHRFVGEHRDRTLTVRDPSVPSYAAADPVCEVVDRDGRRPLSAAGYAALVADAGSLDLFLDATVTVEGGGHRGYRRLTDGRVEAVVLTKHETAAIVELVMSGRALRAGDFKTVTVTAVGKVVEHARRKLDVKLGRYEWRAIHTLAGSTLEAKRWQFRPDGLGRWAVVTVQSYAEQ